MKRDNIKVFRQGPAHRVTWECRVITGAIMKKEYTPVTVILFIIPSYLFCFSIYNSEMPSKTEKEVIAARQPLYELVWPLISDFDNKNWSLKTGTDASTHGLVYKGSHPKLGTIWKVEVVINISVAQFEKHFYENGEFEWMKDLRERKVLERHDDGKQEWSWGVEYARTVGQGTVQDRDFVSYNFHQRTSDGWLVDLKVSTDHPEDPKITSGVTRFNI